MRKLPMPIHLFDCCDLGIDLDRLQKKISDFYQFYENDLYLLNSLKLDYLKARNILPHDAIIVDLEELDLDGSVRSVLDNLKPTRKRLISEYIVEIRDQKVDIFRIEHLGFEQKYALNTNNVDYRKQIRKFKELPNELFDDDLKVLISYVALKIYNYSQISKFKLIVHHTLVNCIPNQISTNSPEGIHQDGMDFIMSAFVVERKNIKGGTSFIYDSDKQSKIFETTLKDGYGILQPDINTESVARGYRNNPAKSIA